MANSFQEQDKFQFGHGLQFDLELTQKTKPLLRSTTFQSLSALSQASSSSGNNETQAQAPTTLTPNPQNNQQVSAVASAASTAAAAFALAAVELRTVSRNSATSPRSTTTTPSPSASGRQVGFTIPSLRGNTPVRQSPTSPTVHQSASPLTLAIRARSSSFQLNQENLVPDAVGVNPGYRTPLMAAIHANVNLQVNQQPSRHDDTQNPDVLVIGPQSNHSGLGALMMHRNVPIRRELPAAAVAAAAAVSSNSFFNNTTSSNTVGSLENELQFGAGNFP